MSKPDPRIELLPGQLKPVAEICGVDAIEKLIEEFGGRRLYVPKAAVSMTIVDRCGRELADALRECYGGDYIVVPLARHLATTRKHEAIRRDPRSAAEVAREWKMSVISVYRIRGEKAAAKAAPARQPGRPRVNLGIVDLEELIDRKSASRSR